MINARMESTKVSFFLKEESTDYSFIHIELNNNKKR